MNEQIQALIQLSNQIAEKAQLAQIADGFHEYKSSTGFKIKIYFSSKYTIRSVYFNEDIEVSLNRSRMDIPFDMTNKLLETYIHNAKEFFETEMQF